MRFLCVLIPFLLAACGQAGARETNMPSLTVEYVQADTARVIARWSRPCDSKGCADSYRVQWGASAAVKLLTRTADTAYFPRPAIGDTAVVTVAVTSVRRNIVGATRTATAVLRNPDAPPPAVDSLRADTLTAYEAALLDTFPAIAIRDSMGRRENHAVKVGESFILCALSRNRYTGEAVVMLSDESSPEDQDRTAEACEHARAMFEAERDG